MTASTPIRIQRKRSKGWRMPPNTKSVTRPGMFGNPYAVEPATLTDENGSRKVWMVTGAVVPALVFATKLEAATEAVRLYRAALKPRHIAAMRRVLSGYDCLACFCELSMPCHIDVILDVMRAPVCEEVAP